MESLSNAVGFAVGFIFKIRTASPKCCFAIPIIPSMLCNFFRGRLGFKLLKHSFVNSFWSPRNLSTKSSMAMRSVVNWGCTGVSCPRSQVASEMSLFHFRYVSHSVSHMKCLQDRTPSGLTILKVRLQVSHWNLAVVGFFEGWNFTVRTVDCGPQKLQLGGGRDQGARVGMDGA